MNVRMNVRLRLARWALRAAAWLAWRIGGKAAFGRVVAAYRARTASGPGGAGTGELGGTGGTEGQGEPLGGPVVIEIPADVYRKAKAALWWAEERQRADEAFLFDRGMTIQLALIQDGGLLKELVTQLGSGLARLGTEIE